MEKPGGKMTVWLPPPPVTLLEMDQFLCLNLETGKMKWKKKPKYSLLLQKKISDSELKPIKLFKPDDRPRGVGIS